MTGYQKASVEDVLNQLMEENRKLIKRVETLEENLVKLSNDNKDLKPQSKKLYFEIHNESGKIYEYRNLLNALNNENELIIKTIPQTKFLGFILPTYIFFS